MTADTARVTLAEIAAEAGVSLATMSKVLNGRTDVAPATRARLEEHLARHGYTRRNATQRTEFVELVFHELEPSWSMEVIEGVEDVAHAAGLSVVLTVSGDRHAPVRGVDRRRAAPPAGRRRSWSSPTSRRATARSCARAASRS